MSKKKLFKNLKQNCLNKQQPNLFVQILASTIFGDYGLKREVECSPKFDFFSSIIKLNARQKKIIFVHRPN